MCARDCGPYEMKNANRQSAFFCELKWFGQSTLLALKSEKISGSISLFMKDTIPGTHGTIVDRGPHAARPV